MRVLEQSLGRQRIEADVMAGETTRRWTAVERRRAEG